MNIIDALLVSGNIDFTQWIMYSISVPVILIIIFGSVWFIWR